MKRCLWVLTLFLFSSSVYSQDTYTTFNNETVHGSIVNNKEWARNPSSVLFKDSASGSNIELTPADCKAFTAGSSDKYISYTGSRIINADRVENAHALQSATITKDSMHVFLREIYQFKEYTLYKYADDKRANFYLEYNGNIKELEYYEYLNEDKQVVPYDNYKNYLLGIFTGKGISNLQQKIEALAYKENDLINFLANTLSDKGHASEKLRNKYPVEIFIGPGINANFGSISFSTGTTYHQTGISPSFDIGLRLYSQRNFGKLFFQPAINVTALSQTFKEGITFTNKATLASFKIGAGYMFVKKPTLSFYAAVQGGITFLFGYKTGSNGNYVTESSPDDKATVHPEIGVTIKRKINIALTGTLPFEVPSVAKNNSSYKISQAYLLVRYIL